MKTTEEHLAEFINGLAECPDRKYYVAECYGFWADFYGSTVVERVKNLVAKAKK